MEKFEYMQLVCNPIGAVSRELTNDLNEFGANGWEAYAVRSMSDDSVQIFLKRKIHE